MPFMSQCGIRAERLLGVQFVPPWDLFSGTGYCELLRLLCGNVCAEQWFQFLFRLFCGKICVSHWFRCLFKLQKRAILQQWSFILKPVRQMHRRPVSALEWRRVRAM